MHLTTAYTYKIYVARLQMFCCINAAASFRSLFFVAAAFLAAFATSTDLILDVDIYRSNPLTFPGAFLVATVTPIDALPDVDMNLSKVPFFAIVDAATFLRKLFLLASELLAGAASTFDALLDADMYLSNPWFSLGVGLTTDPPSIDALLDTNIYSNELPFFSNGTCA